MRIARCALFATAASLGLAQNVAIASGPSSTEPDAATPLAEPITHDKLLDTTFSWALKAEQDDVFGALTAFGLEPLKGVPTPSNAVVASMSVVMYPGEGSALRFEATTNFVSDTPLLESLPLFEAAMAESGFPLLERGEIFEQGDYVSQSVDFAAPNAVHSEVVLSADFTHVGPGHELVEIEYSGEFEPDVAALTAWFADLPMVDEATALMRWTFAAGADPDDLDIEVGADMKFEMTGVELAERFPIALAGSPFTADPDATTNPSDFVLIGSDFDRLEVNLHPIAGPGRLEVFGTIDLPG